MNWLKKKQKFKFNGDDLLVKLCYLRQEIQDLQAANWGVMILLVLNWVEMFLSLGCVCQGFCFVLFCSLLPF